MNATPFLSSLPDESDPEKIYVLLSDLKRIIDMVLIPLWKYNEPENMVDISLQWVLKSKKSYWEVKAK